MSAPRINPSLPALLGTNHQIASAEEIAAFVFPPEEAEPRLRALAEEAGIRELLYLCTCNRVEFLYAVPDGETSCEAAIRLEKILLRGTSFGPDEHPFFLLEGEDAARHVFQVAAGLDSMVLGDAQIGGQIREAVERSRRLGLYGSVLGLLLDEALKAAKKVRSDTSIGAGATSVATLAAEAIAAAAGGVPEASTLEITLIGAGEIAREAARAIRSRGLTRLLFVNRTLARADELAAAHGGRALSLEEWLEDPPPADAIVTATSSPDPLLTADRAALLAERRRAEGRGRHDLLLVDLGLPRNTDPAVEILPGLRVLTMEALREAADRNRAARATEVERALPLVLGQVETWRRRSAGKQAGSAVGALRERLLAEARAGIESARRGALRGLSPEQAAAVERLVEDAVHRVLHEPTLLLREAAASCRCGAAAEVVLGRVPATREGKGSE